MIYGNNQKIISTLTLLLALILPGIVEGHISDKSMPPSVMEMECRIYLEFNPGDTKTRNKLGMALLQQEKLIKAEKEFRTVLDTKPDDFDSLDGIGLIRSRQKEYSQAIKLFKSAIEIRTDDPMVYFHLGQALENNGQLAEALETYQKAAKINAQQPASETKETNSSEITDAITNVSSKLATTTKK
ncbi:MAG: tetratricopeptide repeat protein [Proteobacteria bacterium]|nr:tetratricopeptide repeat protein [Pseudomonadota bacterium]MBU1714052.1 tetratricopeptide repeat protein [Pseudomonadota bacterium]